GRRRNRPRGHEREDAPASAEDRRRAGGALDLSLLWRRMRTARLPPGREARLDRRRSRVADLARAALPEGRSELRAPDPSRAADEGSLPRAEGEAVDASRPRNRDGHGGGPGLGDALAHVRGDARRPAAHAVLRDRAPRRRDPRQRRELPDQE